MEQVLNTKGAAKKLGCTENWIHKLVYKGKIKARIYDDNGVLTERQPHDQRQGQGLYFLESDLDAYKPEKQRRPRGSKDKIADNPNRKKGVALPQKRTKKTTENIATS